MTKVLIWGINGKMGLTIAETAIGLKDIKIVGGFDSLSGNNFCHTYKVFDDPNNINVDYDVIIDFSHASAINNIVIATEKKPRPVVIASTGHDAQEQKKIAALAKKVPVFLSGNMSVGVSVLCRLVKQAASILYGWDVEVVEKHHNQKADAPSGTAKMLVDSVNEGLSTPRLTTHGRCGQAKRSPHEIGVHAVRGGTIIGEHDVIFAGADELITLSHSAQSRKIFALGAFRAAKFLVDKKPKIYNMDDMFGI